MPENVAIAILWVAVLLLGGCAVLYISRPHELSTLSNNSLMAVALSEKGADPGSSLGCKYRNLTNGSVETLQNATTETVDAINSENEHLAVTALPPGRYKFFQCYLTRRRPVPPMWTVGGTGGVTLSNPAYSGLRAPTFERLVAKPFSVKFDVVAGKLTYVGELQLHWYSRGQSGEYGEVTVSDESKRDLPLLYKRVSDLTPDDILLPKNLSENGHGN